MCGSLLSKFSRVENNVNPAPALSLRIDQQLLKKANSLLTSQASETSKTASGANISDLRFLGGELKFTGRSGTWVAFQVRFAGGKILDVANARKPRKLEKLEAAPRLMRAMLLKKQAKAEKNRKRQLEKKRQKTQRATKANNTNDEEVEKIRKAEKIAQKHAKAANNREIELKRVKSTANKFSGSSRRRVLKAQNFAKAQQNYEQWKRKMTSVKENRRKAVEKVVSKQQKREAHAKAVRDRAQRLMLVQQDDDIFLDDDLDVDSCFYGSDTDHDDKELWDKFWGIHKEYQQGASC